jgi:hypothetical protein
MTYHRFEILPHTDEHNPYYSWRCYTCGENRFDFATAGWAEEDAERFHDAEVVEPDPRVLTPEEEQELLACLNYEQESGS